MLKIVKPISLIFSCMLSIVAHAGIVMGGTRVIFEEGKKEASISVTNREEKIPYLVESWIENFDQANHDREPFIVTPPLFRLDAGKESVLRINYLGMSLPTDRESVFWLNVKSIAPMPRDSSNELQVNIKSKFKLFYRPKGLAGKPSDAWRQLTFHHEGNQLIAHNPTPYFISLYSLSVANHAIKDPGMIGPFADHYWHVTDSGAVTWSAINDFGGITEQLSR